MQVLILDVKSCNILSNLRSNFQAGAITFVIGFTGCVGALRENTALLAAYAIFLAILLLLEMTAGILGFIFKDWIKEQATSGFQAFIVHYRDDPDQQNLIDWIQEGWVRFYICIQKTYVARVFYHLPISTQLQCCGIEGPQDWDKNVYFNCSSASVGSREACGVPFSCCKFNKQYNVNIESSEGLHNFLFPKIGKPKADEVIKNVQCGYDVRKPNYVSLMTTPSNLIRN